MDLQDLYKLERELHSYHSQNKVLTQQNDELRSDNQRLRQRVDELQAIVNNQPINLIRQQLDPLSISNSLAQLEDKVNAQAYQISFLQQLLQDKSIMLSQAQSQKNQLEVALHEKDLELSLLSHQVKESSLRQEKNKKEVEMWRGKLEKANQQRLKIANQNQTLSKRLKREQNANHNDLIDLGKGIVAIEESTGKQISKASPSPQNTIQQKIIAVQQEQLQDRNHQIAKLKAINGNYGENVEVQHLKNTIKHLRGEITRYSSIVQHVTEKLAIAETAVINYNQSAQKCLEERKAFAQLNEEVEKMSALKGIEENLTKKTQKLQRQRMELKKNLVDVLNENQSFHQFLFQTFGQNYEQLLKSQIQNYSERHTKRANEGRWGTINELIRVNEILRSKLKMA